MKGSLKVLMIKHLLVRIRGFIQTTVELVSPIIFIVLLFSFKDFIHQPVSKRILEESNVIRTEPMALRSISGPQLVFYTPENNFTKELMKEVGNKLRLESLKHFPSSFKVRGYYPIADMSQLKGHILTMDETQAVVVFDTPLKDLPERLDYTIRIKDDFMVHMYKSLDEDMSPHANFGIVYEPFLLLQWAIDTSYLRMTIGLDVKQTVSLQEFPYVMPRDQNPTISLVANLLKYLCWISLLLSFVFLVARLLAERVNGIEELIKMMGVSPNTLAFSHILNVVPTGLVYSIVNTILITSTSNPLVPATNPLIIALVLAMHFISVVAMAFVCSYLITKTQYSVTLASCAYILLWQPAILLERRGVPQGLMALYCLLPHSPLILFWNELVAVEKFGQGLGFSNMATSHASQTVSVLSCITALAVQSVLYFFIAWYLARVRPGPFGLQLPWNFLCSSQYWCPTKVSPDTEMEQLEDEVVVQDPLYFEEAPKSHEVGIRVANVSKFYNKNAVLSNVSFDIYKGELTVLLGHNGAGKTTLMNIITGMTGATSGNVYVDGMDSVEQRSKVQNLLGLCPQHNLFFPDLTVMEHVMFFSMLKGASYKEAKSESRSLLEKLGLWAKAGGKAAQLSGGMRRRLQLGCALAGKASLLILDEPTSGLDVETRRELWDLLLSLRGDRTVLITTHFMEEADALGDRAAVLHGGKLRCHATPMHLKRALGSGYRLSFTTIGVPKEAAITSTVKSKVPDAFLKEVSLNSISYNLPARSSAKFPELFRTLESKRSELTIDTIGVGVTTLEEVFLKLCSDTDVTFEDTVDGEEPVEPTNKRLTGYRLYLRQFFVLMYRQAMYIKSIKWAFIILEILLPLLLIITLTRYSGDQSDPPPQINGTALMDLNLYSDLPDKRVLMNTNDTYAVLKQLLSKYDVVPQKSADIVESLVDYGEKDVIEYNKYLIGLELNDTKAKVLYTTRFRHAAPVALNLLTNLLSLRAKGASPKAPTLRVYNQPLDSVKRVPFMDSLKHPKSMASAFFYAMFVAYVFLSTSLHNVSLPCRERRSGARHLHLLAGCPSLVHWSATLTTHLLVTVLTFVVPVIITAAVLEQQATFSQPDFLGAFFVILVLSSLAFLTLIYLVSFCFDEKGAGAVLVGFIILFGIFTPGIQTLQETFQGDQARSSLAHLVSKLCDLLATPHTLVLAAGKAVNVARLNAYCTLNRDKCPNLLVSESGFDTEACCVLNTSPRCYFCFDSYSPGESMMYLLLQFVLYSTLVLLTQNGVFKRLSQRVTSRNYVPTNAPNVSEMVRAENTYVNKAITLPPDQIQEAMLVEDLHKNYVNICKKSCNAVKGVSFSVKKGECFGLLGVNGAGKSTTFKMITAESYPTRGTLFADGHHADKERTKYMHSLSYCPQFSGLDDFLTGYDNLLILLTLRGLNRDDVEHEIKAWIETVGLEQHQRRPVAGYSGGMSRRLAAGAALSCAASVALLDEPTAGVDVAARRRVWDAIRRALKGKRSVVVTSHSMDEMEALCGRIGIMAGGRMRALGSAAALRAAHGAGHTVQLKLRPEGADVTDSSKSDVLKIKNELHQKFNCQLKDEHKTMLHYHISDTMRYSDLFTELESLKSSNPIIEDYSVTETTLEEVFLSFAKEGNEEVREAPITPV